MYLSKTARGVGNIFSREKEKPCILAGNISFEGYRSFCR
jgi:hypothetical protein